ncbi:gluconolaconase, partial [Stenotrophomonas maltophilia]
GTVSTVVAAGGVINGPLSLATTHDGVLYVGDLDGRIVQVTPQGHHGTVSTVVAAGGVINGPLSLATTHDGVLYVGDL